MTVQAITCLHALLNAIPTGAKTLHARQGVMCVLKSIVHNLFNLAQ